MDKLEVRIDRFLWAVRIFKTRSIASEACKKSKVLINGKSVKPAKNVNVGDEIDVRKDSIIRTYKVLALLKNRVGAKLVDGYICETTTQEELDKLVMIRHNINGYRSTGTGRPTKKDRRELDGFFDK